MVGIFLSDRALDLEDIGATHRLEAGIYNGMLCEREGISIPDQHP